MGVSILEGNKAERIANALELIAINGSVEDAQSWKTVQNIVRSGLGEKAFPVGTQFVVGKENSLTCAMGAHTGITAVAINEETFLAAEGIVGTGIHEFKFDGAAWIYEGAPVVITTFGITVTGTPAEGDEIIVTEAFDKIVFDVVQHRNAWVIQEYSATSTYAQGDQRKNDGKVYVCTTTISTAEAWNAAHWTYLYDVDEPSMILMMHNCIYGRAFDAAEALIYAESALTAGTYYFSDGAGTPTYYQFTTTQDIPEGGQIVITAWPQSGLSGATMKSFSGPTDTTGIETFTLSTGSEGTSLGTIGEGNINNTSRSHYGSNNYQESALRQWIKSENAKDTWWTPTNKFDRPVGYTNVAGLLHGMDKDFLAVVGKSRVPCKTNNTFELPAWTKNSAYVVEDKFYLASRDEIGYGKENVQEGFAFALYNGVSNVERIKYDLSAQTTARNWFRRSPIPGNADYVRGTYTDGGLDYYYARGGYGAAAACEIK